jgi:glycosyltransferase involved in cell wall biosynthesis
MAVGKEQFGFSDDFMFLFVFDFLSVFNRKNPLAVIEAYIQQFRSMEKSFLVIKTINGHHRPEQLEMLKVATRNRSDILVIDGYFDSELSSELISICDCYVSLHRAEGLGLTMLEAMSYGKPVIATNYSGNCDFMDANNSFPVPFELVKIGQGSDPYNENGVWAQPDVFKAAEYMRKVFENREEGASVGKIAAGSIKNLYNPEKIGNQISSRLTEVYNSLQ